MPYKIVNIFKLVPGKADEEVERVRDSQSMLNLLKAHPGFISYEVVKLGEDSTMTIQSWHSRAHFGQAIGKVNAAREALVAGRENLLVSRESFSGEVVLTG
jgi:hypothetical protein